MPDTFLSQVPEAWRRPCCEGHGVHFYADPQELAKHVVAHIAPGLARGQGGLIVARPSNMLAFEQAAGAAGFQYEEHISCGRLVLFDAHRLLDRFMVDGMPDERRFRAIVGGQLRMLGTKHEGIHIYGEMVAVLLEAGLADAAMALEGLWNGLAHERRFDLLCAYPLSLFQPVSNALPLEQLRKLHGYTLRLDEAA